MCAIFGWVGECPTYGLQQMAAALKHRGPDGYGEYGWLGGAMGMNRLAIVDPENGGQPFYSACGGVAVVCNGQIYNWKELREELEGCGYLFETESDIEVLPAAWLEWGEAMLERLEGMFALAVRDERREGVFLARDRCGQKPLYYARVDQAFIFSSEPVGLFAAGVPRVVNQQAIPMYLMQRYVPEPDTLFRDVYQLQAGHCGWLSARGLESEAWWEFAKLDEGVESARGALEQLERAAAESVAKVCEADTPKALYLSSGVDSAFLLDAVVSSNIPVEAITASFVDQSDESDAAEELCRQYGVGHHKVLCSADDLQQLPRVVEQMQVPVGDALIIAFDKLAEKTAEIGCKVAFGGDGVDELFQGYSFQRLQWIAERVGPMGRWGLGLGLQLCPLWLLDKVSGFPANLGHEGKAKLVRWMRRYGASPDWWKGCGLRTLFEPDEIKKLLGKDVTLPSLSENGDLVQRHAEHQFDGWLQDWSIVRQDRNAMAHSVEYRMPFLEKPMLTLSQKLQISQQLSWAGGKQIWRKLMQKKGLESATAKQPFYFPVSAFLEHSAFLSLLEDCLSETSIQSRGYFSFPEIQRIRESAMQGEFLSIKKLVSLVILELWHRSHIDSDSDGND